MERKEAERKEAEVAAERARQEEQQKLREEAEARIEHKRLAIEEQERREREEEEEEARCRRSHQESTLTPVVAPETELPRSKGKGPELALESEVGQESRRCNSCERWNAECVCIKVSGSHLRIPITDSLVDR